MLSEQMKDAPKMCDGWWVPSQDWCKLSRLLLDFGTLVGAPLMQSRRAVFAPKHSLLQYKTESIRRTQGFVGSKLRSNRAIFRLAYEYCTPIWHENDDTAGRLWRARAGDWQWMEEVPCCDSRNTPAHYALQISYRGIVALWSLIGNQRRFISIVKWPFVRNIDSLLFTVSMLPSRIVKTGSCNHHSGIRQCCSSWEIGILS